MTAEKKREKRRIRELAEKLLITDKTVSKWECGKGLPDVSLMMPLCEILHISVNELANKIDKSPRQINRYRNGQCENLSLSTLAKISEVLHVSISDLLLQT